MLTNWKSHCWKGPCAFDRQDNNFTVTTDTNTSRGGWYCFADVDVKFEDQFVLDGTYHTGNISAVWFNGEDFIGGHLIEPGEPFEVVAGANRLRIDLRLWNKKGTAEFFNITLVQVVVNPGLPIPPPDMAQKHHVTGWKWGRNIALVVHGDLAPVPPDYGQPYEVLGFQHGRSLDLQIGRIYADFEDEEE